MPPERVNAAVSQDIAASANFLSTRGPQLSPPSLLDGFPEQLAQHPESTDFVQGSPCFYSGSWAQRWCHTFATDPADIGHLARLLVTLTG